MPPEFMYSRPVKLRTTALTSVSAAFRVGVHQGVLGDGGDVALDVENCDAVSSMLAHAQR